MVLGLITAIAACPAIIGTTEAVRHGQKQNQREEHRGRKYNLSVTLHRPSYYTKQFSGAPVVLRDGKFLVDTRQDVNALPEKQQHFDATINYLAYPGRKQAWNDAGFVNGEGMVTWINAERHLNWVYVERDTHEVKYGTRADAEPHLVGPWDCTKVDKRLTFRNWEGFIAVQEEDGDPVWALYFDCQDNGLTAPGQIGTKGKRMLEVEIWRKELRRDLASSLAERSERLESRAEKQASQESRLALRDR
jgi:hypothetical protein